MMGSATDAGTAMAGSGGGTNAGGMIAMAASGTFTWDANVVTDSATMLTWQRALDVSHYTWDDAKTYCASLTLAGGGWRLPTKDELLSIVDASFGVRREDPLIDPTAFPNTPSAAFWSSSSSPYVGTGFAWAVHFNDGSSTSEPPSSTYRVRCVR